MPEACQRADTVRIVPAGADVDSLQPGEMLRTTDPRIFIKACPLCGRRMATGEKHTITEQADGTVTIRASCLCPYEDCDAHYYVTNSRIEWL